MRLTHLRVVNYKCIRDSETFRIDPKVTALVGKNESGKTALLQALTKLNPVDSADSKFDALHEYPRHEFTDYEAHADTKPSKAVETVWVLGDEDLAQVEELVGPVARTIKNVAVTKGYDNVRRYSVECDEASVVRHLIDKHELLKDERKGLEKLSSISDLRKELEGVSDPSQRQKTLLQDVIDTFDAKTAKTAIINLLDGSCLPKIACFSEYLRMPGQVAVNDLQKKKKENKPTTGPEKVFLALLDLIGRSIDDLQNIKQHEALRAALEAASNKLTREIFKYWTQNRHLKIQFLFEQALPGDAAPFNEGWILRTRIENTRHGVTTSFDQRSAGFVWFFSFLIWFSQVRKNYGDNLIILLDEPGLSLHAKAQADLLRYIEECLAPTYQVLYTTHSPFMLDPSNLLRARTVEDIFRPADPKDPTSIDEDLGTKVGDNVLSTDRDTVFPLQACLGYEITQTLFIGEHTLLVEGPGEILYFQWFKRKLKALGRETLDDRWTIAPCGGIDKIPAFLSLFAGNQLHIAVFTDFAEGQKKRVRELRESKLLLDGHVLTAEAYSGQAEADIEDVIGRTAYADLVRQAYALSEAKSLPAKRPKGAPERLVKEVEAHFRTLPPEVSEFDHYRPAEYLTQQGVQSSLSGLDEALDRFESIFRALNSLLP